MQYLVRNLYSNKQSHLKGYQNNFSLQISAFKSLSCGAISRTQAGLQKYTRCNILDIPCGCYKLQVIIHDLAAFHCWILPVSAWLCQVMAELTMTFTVIFPKPLKARSETGWALWKLSSQVQSVQQVKFMGSVFLSLHRYRLIQHKKKCQLRFFKAIHGTLMRANAEQMNS